MIITSVLKGKEKEKEKVLGARKKQNKRKTRREGPHTGREGNEIMKTMTRNGVNINCRTLHNQFQ